MLRLLLAAAAVTVAAASAAPAPAASTATAAGTGLQVCGQWRIPFDWYSPPKRLGPIASPLATKPFGAPCL